MSIRRYGAAALVLLAFGCEPAEEAPAPAAPRTASTTVAATYAPELQVDLGRTTRTATGLHYEDLTVGAGDSVTVGTTAQVHYTGWLPDGTMFDTSRDGDPPLDVRVGAGGVIDGWEEGLQGMRVGGRRRLIIPPSLGYGLDGAGGGVIPPDATLVFDVEVVGVR
jgi:FKBP-type peptidyl-prolyl cis-trans isomerase